MKPALLLLCHRLPYPPNKGEKIRAFHILEHLRERFRIFLGTFYDDPADAKHVEAMRERCEQVYVARLYPKLATLKSALGLLDGRALTLPYYSHSGMREWAARTVRDEDVQAVLVYSSAMAQFVPQAQGGRPRVVIDFVDVDSDKWRQYAPTKRWPMDWVYRREAKRLLCFEQRAAQEADASLFVSDNEAELFRQLAPRSADKTLAMRNGVDLTNFDASLDYSCPYDDQAPRIVFTGAMDYWPNVEGVVWFAEEILPLIRERVADAQFYVVGSNPSPEVRRLAGLAGVFVTGRVPDVRPYVAHADCAVAPLRLARGVQNKVLEAMAMRTPVVVSPSALEGISAEPGGEVLLAEDERGIADAVVGVLRAELDTQGLVEAAWRRVRGDYDWSINLSVLDDLFQDVWTGKRLPG